MAGTSLSSVLNYSTVDLQAFLEVNSKPTQTDVFFNANSSNKTIHLVGQQGQPDELHACIVASLDSLESLDLDSSAN